MVSQAAMKEAKASILSAFDENKDGRIDIAEVWNTLAFILYIYYKSYIMCVFHSYNQSSAH